MAVISAPDLVKLRTQVSSLVCYFSVLQPVTLLTALVNNASATRGMRTIAYDTGTGSGFATIEAGQTLEVDTADGTFRTRVKSITGNQVSGSIVVDENPLVWLDNQVIRVIHSYDIQPIPPVIRSQIFYKFYDLVFSDQTVEPPPVAIIGSHLAGFLSAGSIVFQLNSSSSYAIADGASISSRVWSCVHMGGGTTGITISNTTTANPTLTLTIAGQYWLKCVVTDSNGKSQSTYRAIFIYDANNLPYKDFAIQSLSGDWSSGGWRATIVPFGDATLDDFPDRQLCLLWYIGKFNSTEDYVNLWAINADNIILGGYIRQDNDTDQFNDGTGNVSFEVTTPDGVIDNISELGSISLNAVASPGFWYEYETWMTAGRSIHHLIKYHSYGVLQCWDVLGLNEDTRGVLQAEFTEGALLQQINGLTFDRGIYAKMACDFMGRFHLVKDSNILNDAGRAALDTVMTILEADISGVVTLVRAPEETVSFAELNGFSFNGSVSTPFISILPGYRESSVSYIMPNLRGSGTMSIGNQILSSQTDSNERIGRVLAQQNNNPRELRFAPPYSGLGVFDIIRSIGWYEWGISDADLKRNTELFERRLICASISHTFDHSAGTVQTELAFEPEAFGPDGIQGNYPTGYPAIIPPEPNWTPPEPEPITPGFAYFAGGFDGSYIATTERITFATGVTADWDNGDLSQARGAPGWASDRETYGYFAGGFQSGSVYLDDMDRITLATGITAAFGSVLTTAKEAMFSLADFDTSAGYFAGGVVSGGTAIDNSDKINFSSGAITADTNSNLSADRDFGTGFNSGSTYGYFAGGETNVATLVDITDRLTFSTGVTAAYPTGDLTAVRAFHAAVSDAVTYAYVAGGQDTIGDLATAERMTFSTGVFALNAVSDLSVARVALGSASDGATYGYFIGGSGLDTADRIVYSTGVTSANGVSDLVAGKSYFAGLNDGSVS